MKQSATTSSGRFLALLVSGVLVGGAVFWYVWLQATRDRRYVGRSWVVETRRSPWDSGVQTDLRRRGVFRDKLVAEIVGSYWYHEQDDALVFWSRSPDHYDCFVACGDKTPVLLFRSVPYEEWHLGEGGLRRSRPLVDELPDGTPPAAMTIDEIVTRCAIAGGDRLSR